MRTVTYARSVVKLLESRGYSARQVKSPRSIGSGGCGYAVVVKKAQPGDIADCIGGAGLPNFKIYVTSDGKSFDELRS